MSGWNADYAPAPEQLRRQRSRLLALVGQRLRAGWVGWELARDRWQPVIPVVLVFDGGVQLELAWDAADRLSISWNTIDLRAASHICRPAARVAIVAPSPARCGCRSRADRVGGDREPVLHRRRGPYRRVADGSGCRLEHGRLVDRVRGRRLARFQRCRYDVRLGRTRGALPCDASAASGEGRAGLRRPDHLRLVLAHRQMSKLIKDLAVSSTTLRSRWCRGSGLCRGEAPVASRRGRPAERVSFPRGHAVVVLLVSGAKRRTPVVVVRKPRTAPLSAEGRRRAVTALAVMIHQWWSGGQGRSAKTVRGSDPSAAPRRMAISELVRVGVGVRPSG